MTTIAYPSAAEINTAYDTQRMREMLMDGTATHSAEIQGALTLYLDFINLFISLLQIIGVKKE